MSEAFKKSPIGGLKGPMSEAFKSHLLIFVLIIDQLRFVVNSRVGWHAAGQPDTTADGAVMAHHCLTTQNGGTGVDHHVIFDRRMPFGGRILLPDTECSQCHSLVDLYMVADSGGLPDHNPGAVVDAEVASDDSTRVDVDTG